MALDLPHTFQYPYNIMCIYLISILILRVLYTLILLVDISFKCLAKQCL